MSDRPQGGRVDMSTHPLSRASRTFDGSPFIYAGHSNIDDYRTRRPTDPQGGLSTLVHPLQGGQVTDTAKDFFQYRAPWFHVETHDRPDGSGWDVWLRIDGTFSSEFSPQTRDELSEFFANYLKAICLNEGVRYGY